MVSIEVSIYMYYDLSELKISVYKVIVDGGEG